MALTNTITADTVRERLTPWLQARAEDGETVAIEEVSVSSANGLSNETIMVDTMWSGAGEPRPRRLVVRVQPQGEGVFPAYDVAKEARIMSALAGTGAVRVPTVCWQDDDPSVLGAPFLVMDFVAGRVPSDDPPFPVQGWVMELSPSQRRTLSENALAQLATLVTLDPDAVGLDFLRDPRYVPGTAAQLERWRGIFAWASEGEDNPIIQAAFEWLGAHVPDDGGDLRLSWGDARHGNFIFADDLSIAAMLDWEDASLCAPGTDLGWLLAMTRHHTEGIGAELPEGFLTREETIARYEELTRRPVRDLHFHETFAATKVSILMVRAAHMLIAAGALPPDSPMALNNPALNILAATLGVAAPGGTTVSYIGNR